MNLMKKHIADTYIELCNTMPIDKISLTLLTKKADISKPTFYRYFKDKYDLIEWIYYQDLLLQTEEGQNYLCDKRILVQTLDNMNKKRVFYRKALSLQGQNSLFNSMVNQTIDFTLNALKSYLKTDYLSDNLTHALIYHAYGGMAYITEWMKSDDPINSEIFADNLYGFMPEIIKKALQRESD